MIPSRSIAAFLLSCIAAALLLSVGCSQPISEVTQPRVLFGTRADPILAVDLAKITYPKDAPDGADYDILALIDGDTIRFVNRTTTAHADVQVWLNQQYVGLIDQLPVGKSDAYAMGDFINQYGEAYPVGGFLNPDKTFPVVLAELYNPALESNQRQRHKLIVRKND